MLYKVAVTETRRRIVAVEADSSTIAHHRVSDAWQNGEVMLDDEDFEGAEVYVIGETENTDGLFVVERKNV
jgi:hypothetical protein